jgi:hypothetical protein
MRLNNIKQPVRLPVSEPTEHELFEPWNQQAQKDYLIDRIKKKKEEGELPLDVKINEKLLAAEHLKVWLNIPIEDKLFRLLQHPLMTKQDKQKIDVVLEHQKNQQAKVGVGMTLATSAVYWMFLSRKDTFYRVFNNKNSYFLVNLLKKATGLYAVWIAWLVVLNNHYEKAIPNKLHDEGYFKKYKLAFDKRSY